MLPVETNFKIIRHNIGVQTKVPFIHICCGQSLQKEPGEYSTEIFKMQDIGEELPNWTKASSDYNIIWESDHRFAEWKI